MASHGRIAWIFDFGLRRMEANKPPGWTFPMGIFASIALLDFLSRELKQNTSSQVLVLSAVDVAATLYFLNRSRQHLFQFGISGPSRARWWIEIAAVLATVFLGAEALKVLLSNPVAGRAVLNPAAFHAMKRYSWSLMFPFWACCIASFLLGIIRGRPVRGRSAELAIFMFWSSIAIAALIVFLPQQGVNGNAIGLAGVEVGIIATVVAGALAIWQWWNNSGRQDNP